MPVALPRYLILRIAELAGRLGDAGEVESGMHMVDGGAIARCEREWRYEPELLRMKAELLIAKEGPQRRCGSRRDPLEGPPPRRNSGRPLVGIAHRDEPVPASVTARLRKPRGEAALEHACVVRGGTRHSGFAIGGAGVGPAYSLTRPTRVRARRRFSPFYNA